MIKFLSQLLDLIYKKRCYFCGSYDADNKMCKSCYEKIKFLPVKPLKSVNNVDTYSSTIYCGNTQKLIRGLKYHNQTELAYYQAKLMYDYFKESKMAGFDITVIPVPLHKSREKSRKYNHMELVAQEFAKLGGYKLETNLIKRIKDTKPQYKLSKKEREENMSGAFELVKENRKKYLDERLLIIDDILTTGSTLSEVVDTLRKGGLYHMRCFVTACSEYNIIE